MFGEILEHVLKETPGAVGVTLMGFDGIAIDSREADDPGSVSLQTAAVELGAIASQLKGVAESLGAGDVREVTVHLSNGAGAGLVTVLRPVTAEYFVALSLLPDGNTGKGRYLLRVAAPKLAAELEL
jgi:predicted regulator of Ras-like GTPase activity (Roadblock/LC7/MglB family)